MHFNILIVIYCSQYIYLSVGPAVLMFIIARAERLSFLGALAGTVASLRSLLSVLLVGPLVGLLGCWSVVGLPYFPKRAAGNTYILLSEHLFLVRSSVSYFVGVFTFKILFFTRNVITWPCRMNRWIDR